MGKWFGQAAEIEALRAENHQLSGQVESLEVRLRAAYGEAGITSLSQEAPAPRPLATARSSASERPPGQPHAHDRGLTTVGWVPASARPRPPGAARGRAPTRLLLRGGVWIHVRSRPVADRAPIGCWGASTWRLRRLTVH